MADDVALLQARLKAALELVHDPKVELFKRVVPSALSSAASVDVLRQRCVAMIRHVWSLIYQAYGIRLGKDFYALHRPGDVLNCLTLTPDLTAAERILHWWAGPPMVISTVSSVEQMPERWIAMGLALHWKSPSWL